MTLTRLSRQSPTLIVKNRNPQHEQIDAHRMGHFTGSSLVRDEATYLYGCFLEGVMKTVGQHRKSLAVFCQCHENTQRILEYWIRERVIKKKGLPVPYVIYNGLKQDKEISVLYKLRTLQPECDRPYILSIPVFPKPVLPNVEVEFALTPDEIKRVNYEL